MIAQVVVWLAIAAVAVAGALGQRRLQRAWTRYQDDRAFEAAMRRRYGRAA